MSRYDAATGELIVPPFRRIGLLDRELRVVNDNAQSYQEWMRWVQRAFQSCYGFEYQGDSLLSARINMIMTFNEYYVERWGENPDTGEKEHFDGHLFDPIVFNDSVKEFLGLKVRLADYFDEALTEVIFDYIPPQMTNQIFTPKPTVKDMVDMLERENPGCFDDSDHTFADQLS